MKKILCICFSVFLLIGLSIGLFSCGIGSPDNGRIVFRNGRLYAEPDIGYKLAEQSGGRKDGAVSLFKKPTFVREQLDLPIISIETEGNEKITSKEVYLNCTVSISADGALSFEGKTARVKGRGNSTFGFDKKPYKIKFDEKVAVLGEAEAKEWTLIANYMDYSLVRNYLAYTLGAALDLAYTTSANFAEVFVNGEYMGVYLVCEQVEVGKNRVNIEDSLSIDETGYLLELDARAPSEGKEGVDYFYSIAGALPYAIKSPDTGDEEFTTERVEFIKNYLDAAYEALIGTDYSEVCRYLDVDTFVNGYILDELLKTTDVGFSSFYLYKDAGGKLCRGPIWDYDLAAGNSVASGAVSPSGIYAGVANNWYARLLTFPEFRSAVAARLLEKNDVIRQTMDAAFLEADSYGDSFARNFEKWDLLGQHSMPEYTSREICEIDTIEGQFDYLKNWLTESLAYLNREYAEMDTVEK